MAEKAALAVTASASAVAGYGWVEQANDIATLGVTVMAFLGAIAAALYHLERYKKLKAERKQEKKDG